ncbi:MAG: helix-turn-helix domain-containing protein [Acidobacteriota bacterium]
MINFNKKLQEKLKDPEFAKYYEEERILLEVALKIAQERERKGLTQSELAIKANLTQQQVSKLESGASSNVMTLLKVCKALHLRIFVGSEEQINSRRIRAAKV